MATPATTSYDRPMIEAFARVRSAEAGDAEALARVHERAWRLAYAGIIPHAHLRAMVGRRDEAWFERNINGSDATLALEAGGAVAGYATLGRSRTFARPEGEIYELYLAPEYQGLGFGERLFDAARDRLRRRGLRGLLVWALTDNVAACDFYRARGGKRTARGFERFGKTVLEKTAYCWE